MCQNSPSEEIASRITATLSSVLELLSIDYQLMLHYEKKLWHLINWCCTMTRNYDATTRHMYNNIWLIQILVFPPSHFIVHASVHTYINVYIFYFGHFQHHGTLFWFLKHFWHFQHHSTLSDFSNIFGISNTMAHFFNFSNIFGISHFLTPYIYILYILTFLLYLIFFYFSELFSSRFPFQS